MIGQIWAEFGRGSGRLQGVVSQRNRCLRANIEGASDPCKGYTPLVRKAKITRLGLMPICGTYIQKCRKAYTTDIHHRTEIRSTACASLWTARAASSTTCTWSAYGAASSRKRSTGTPTRRWPRPGRGLPITCATSTKSGLTRDLTTERPTTYSTNENRCPKQHNPTRQYT